MPAAGSTLFEMLLALAIASATVTVFVRTVAVARAAAERVSARAVRLQRRVRAVEEACHCRSEAENPAAPAAVGSPPTGTFDFAEFRLERRDGETLVIARFPSDSVHWAVCGAPGSRRWRP
jgi:hypothetical protein